MLGNISVGLKAFLTAVIPMLGAKYVKRDQDMPQPARPNRDLPQLYNHFYFHAKVSKTVQLLFSSAKIKSNVLSVPKHSLKSTYHQYLDLHSIFFSHDSDNSFAFRIFLYNFSSSVKRLK